MARVINLFSPLSVTARRSITFDRRLKFASRRDLEGGIGTETWFCGRPPLAKGLGPVPQQMRLSPSVTRHTGGGALGELFEGNQ